SRRSCATCPDSCLDGDSCPGVLQHAESQPDHRCDFSRSLARVGFSICHFGRRKRAGETLSHRRWTMRTCIRRSAICCIALGLLTVMALTASAPPEAQPVVNVTVVKSERKTVWRHIELPAQVEPSKQAELYARVAGVVQKVHADLGDRVKQGQVLAELAVPELEQGAAQK